VFGFRFPPTTTLPLSGPPGKGLGRRPRKYFFDPYEIIVIFDWKKFPPYEDPPIRVFGGSNDLGSVPYRVVIFLASGMFMYFPLNTLPSLFTVYSASEMVFIGEIVNYLPLLYNPKAYEVPLSLGCEFETSKIILRTTISFPL